jgi:hypothetical protein
MLDQFVIWGVTADGGMETLLVSEHAGLKDRAHAVHVCEMLRRDYGCTALRIQRLAPLNDAVEVADMFRHSINA